ncbi:MAG: hypothetical protein JW861_01300, partial [Bacteroidales bacterium]|nr:hypothetical protein [Bacteroidales bacterium]
MKTRVQCLTALAAVMMSASLAAQTFTVSLKAFLEGPFDGTSMTTTLNSHNELPLFQPYNTPPWNYTGNEMVPVIPNADVVDWVLIRLRETPGDASTAYEEYTVATQAGFILKDGTIVSTDGSSPLQFTCTVTCNLYAVVCHRNHLAVMSGNALAGGGSQYSYDFSTGEGQAYGGATGHKELAQGVWGMVSGDANADGQVNTQDKVDFWCVQVGNSGYLESDFSLNGQVDNVDKVEHWNCNCGCSTQMPGPWECGNPMLDSRDGQFYTTVETGTQCWMAGNLNIGTMIPGTSNQTNNGTIEKYCYDDNPAQCDEYGGLYQWDEMMRYLTIPGFEGICPNGWHVPTDAEWCILEQYVDPNITCSSTGWRGVDGGGKLKEAGYAHWALPNTGATNFSGFTALPGGGKSPSGSFFDLTYYGYSWSSSAYGPGAWYRSLSNTNAQVFRNSNNKLNSYSVRCVLGAYQNQPPAAPSGPNPVNNATGQPLDTQLSWTCSDPENDPLTFDVYFGTSTPPPQVSAGQASYTYNPGNLDFSTEYFWKVVAHDDHGNTTEGPVWSFKTLSPFLCGDTLIDLRDGQKYTTVQIGSQCWMAGNLNIGTMIYGSSNQTNNGTIEKYCYYNSTANCNEYGGLYQWNEMMQYALTQGVQGICPDGWHVPTDAEWFTMEHFVDATITLSGGWRGVDGGGRLKETGYEHWSPPNTGAINSSGFTARGGGYRNQPGIFEEFKVHGVWWSSSSSGGVTPTCRALSFASPQVMRGGEGVSNGFSVRCIMDGAAPGLPQNPVPPDNFPDQPVNTSISWSCHDPGNNLLTYDVYFGKTNPPALVSAFQADTTYNPGLLDFNTVYYWKIIAHNIIGFNAEGPVWSFSTTVPLSWHCGDSLVDPRDGQVYATVQTVNQCWMSGNLNIGTPIDGTFQQSNNGTIEKYCYGNSALNCDEYGGLYQWNE